MVKSIFENILVPYDGSSYSKKALESALNISNIASSKIHLVSVVSFGYIQPPGGLLGLKSSTKNAAKNFFIASKNEAKKALSQQAKYCEKRGVKINYWVKTGNIAEEILKFAKQKKVSIIIIGSQGRHGFGKLKTLGSISRKVSELANCPVLIIR